MAQLPSLDPPARASAYRLTFILIQASGFWQVQGQWRQAYAVYRALVLGGFVVLFASEVVALRYAQSDLVAFNDVMCTASAVGIIVLKAAFLLPAARRVERLQEDLDRSLGVTGVGINSRDHAVLGNAAEKVRRLTMLATGAMTLTSALWASFPLIDGTRKLPLPFWWPSDLTASPLYEVIYVYHTAMLFSAAICLAATDVMFCGFLIQTAAHYDLLTSYMGELGSWLRLGISHPPTMRAVAKRGLAHVIRHHQAIIRCVGELEEVYRGPILVQLLGGTILVCVAGFEIFVLTNELNTHILSRAFYLLIAMADLFLYCSQSELIMGKSETVAVAAYNLPWERMSCHHQFAVMTIVAQARRPPHMSVGHFRPLSLATYLSVLKTAYSIFSLLRQMIDKQ